MDEMDATTTELSNCTQAISDDDYVSSDDCVVVVAEDVPADTELFASIAKDSCAHKRPKVKQPSIPSKKKASVRVTGPGDAKAAKYELKKRKSNAYHRAKKLQLQQGASAIDAAAAAQHAYSSCQ